MPTRSAIAALLAVAALLPACARAPSPPHGADALDIVLAPQLRDGAVAAVDVRLTIPAPAARAGEPLLEMAIVRATMPAALADPDALVASDAAGPLPLARADDPADPSNFRQDRRWSPTRDSVGDVTVAYTLTPRVITAQTRPGPLYDMRTEGAGFYGSGHTMFALPADGWPRRARIAFDLSAMPAGARGASSLGESGAEAEVSKSDLSSVYVMAGPLYSQPKDGSGGFVVYWLTPPAFDLDGAARWTQKAHDYASQFFGRERVVFRAFMRTTARFQGGGSGGFNSFIFGTVAGEDRDGDEVRQLLAHELFHSFVGGLGAAGGGGGAGQQWYSEGANTYYTSVLPFRAGLRSLERTAQDFNDLALAYYTNPQSGLSNEEVTRLFFSNGDAQLVPYQRGPLYFALVDARLRAAHGGARRVDDLVFAFIRGRDAAPDPTALWRELVVGALGEAGGAEFDAMMAGARLDLPSDLLGPCFRSEERRLSRFTLGFRPITDDEGVTRATRLDDGSPALRAGLREGDVIENPQALDAVDRKTGGSTLALEVVRGEERFELVYAPWTPERPGRQWTRTTTPESDCNI